MSATLHWLKSRDLLPLITWAKACGWLMDHTELERGRERFFHLCYGAYEADRLIGAITGYLHERSGWLGNFIVDPAHRQRGVGARLFKLALRAVLDERPGVTLCAAPQMVPFYQRHGFEKQGAVGRFVRPGQKGAGTSLADARALESDRFDKLCALDRAVFGEDRTPLLTHDLKSQSGLLLASEAGVLYSRVMDAQIFLGPWLIAPGAYMEAERLLRAAITLRGKRTLVVDLPCQNSDGVLLMQQYGFVEQSRCEWMACGEVPPVAHDQLYGFATAGSHG